MHLTISKKMAPPTIYSLLILCILSSTSTMAFPSQENSPQDFVNAHNRARAAVDVGSLVWNDTLAAYALGYAQRRYPDCQLEHSMGPYGENLAEGWDGFSAVDAVGMWAGEESCYDYGSNSCVGGACGHYTQVVWRESVRLGCARLQCRNGGVFVICDYDPPGNYIGERPY